MTRPHSSVSVEDLLLHSRWIRRLAAELSSDPGSAEDLVQETWLRALTKPPGSPLALRAWLGRVLRNLAIDRGREQQLRGRSGADLGDAAELPAAGELVERLDIQRVLVEELMRTPEPYRKTILLVYYEDIAPSEVARRQGIPPGTVRWRLKHGLDLLRSRLDDRLGEQPGNWALALAALADPRSASVRRGLAVTSSSFTGAVLMSTGMKLSVSVVGLIALGTIVWKLDPSGSPPTLGTAEAAVAPSLQPLPDEEPLLAGETSDAGVGRTDAVVENATVSVVEETTGDPETSLTARFLDTGGLPISGVRLDFAFLDNRAYGAAVSGPDGRAELTIAWSRVEKPSVLLWGEQNFMCRAAGKATHSMRVGLEERETVHVGEITLEPAGEIWGIVVDQNGEPVADSTVFAAPSSYRVRQNLDEQGGSLSAHMLLEHDASTRPSTQTDSSGSFRLDDVAAGRRRVWSGTRDTRFSYSALIEVVAGEVHEGALLVLEALRHEDVIEGVVLDPEGMPRQRALVQAAYSVRTKAGNRSGSYGAFTDEEGRFKLRLEAHVPHDLTVRDAELVFAPILCEAIEPGSRDLVLRFRGELTFEIFVHDTSGSPIEQFKTWTFEIEDEQQALEQRIENALWSSSRIEGGIGPHDNGRARVSVRSERFDMLVYARGGELLALGPLDLREIGEQLECTVITPPAVRGRVHAQGRPLQGASIEVMGMPATGGLRTAEEMPCLVDPSPLDRTTTDASGRFSVFCDLSALAGIWYGRKSALEDGAFRLRAAADGFAPAFIEVRPDEEALDIELTPGGSITGRVLTDPGTNPAGTIVGVTNGDGHPRSTRCTEDGRFLLENLTPGPWYVMRLDEDIRKGVTGSVRVTGEERFPTSCVVVEGEETHYDLDLRGTLCELTGRLALGGVDTSGWLVRLHQLDRSRDDALIESVKLDARGHFAATLPRSTRFRLSVWTLDRAPFQVTDTLELDDATLHWELALELGELSVAGVPTDGKRLFHRHAGSGELRVLTTLTVDSAGNVAPTVVPAGDGAIVQDSAGNREEANYSVLATLTVEPGELLNVQLVP